MKTQQIRKTFLDYFASKGHSVVPSSSLVPGNDKTLLFTNAGMVQFKDVFLGLEQQNYSRATTSQKCVRAGGKHNDLENVGYTARHHTFFEMLGNFSFGDYFKEDAIKYCWELLTDKFGLAPEKLWITVFEDDDDAYNIWAEQIGVPKDRISRIGKKDNFWQMGETGPCGPCTEVFYDHGEHIWGGPPGTAKEDGDRFIEIWNLVFMQYNRQSDGELIPLPKPSVDTGMGLERIAAILQGVHSNYEIDLFTNLITAAATVTNTTDLEHNSLKVIADHIRSTTFLLADGVIPSNEGRGYVLRRIIRRAIRHGYKLGQKELFFYQLVSALIIEMGEVYPEIKQKQIELEKRIKSEEQMFARTLESGMQLLENDLEKIKNNTISGETLFKLYDTYGFPVDLTCDIARERKLEVDMEGYDDCMAKQRQQAKKGGSFKTKELLATEQKTKFLGYTETEIKSEILEIFVNNKKVKTIKSDIEDNSAIIITAQTPFYGESGGQVGDTGIIEIDVVNNTYSGDTSKLNEKSKAPITTTIKVEKAEFIVTNTQKQGETILHFGYLKQGILAINDKVLLTINDKKRQNIARNHSATHLLHSALRHVLGNAVEQKGSLVTGERLRFDFTYNKPVSTDDLEQVERLANKEVLKNNQVIAKEMTQEQAAEKGAMALFGEKYGNTVRVLTMGENSIELCGGTHIIATGSIGQIIITSESGVASGIRRIEAVTGFEAINYRKEKETLIQAIMQKVKANPQNFENKINQLLETQKDLQKQIKNIKKGIAPHKSHFEANINEINGFKVLTSKVKGYKSDDLRDLADQMRDQNNLDLVLLASEEDGKVKLVISIVKQSTDKLHAGKIIGQVAKIVDGKGGGRDDFAQAGGNDSSKIDEALGSLEGILLSI